MTISDARRRLLHDRLVDAMGEEAAEVLMEHLPPAGWVDLATKSDVATAKADMQHEIALLRLEMAKFGFDLRAELASFASTIDRRMATQTRTLMLAMVTTMAASVGAAVGIAH
ncbi:MAG TPA: hypothetical protein VHD58_02935 [Mycobacteriales bacterium]|nr:hypothetical protein [Mycobacteriales bacterium]